MNQKRMGKVKKPLPLKTLLREEAIPTLTAERPYFSLEMVRKEVAARKWPLADSTLLNYLQELVLLGRIPAAYVEPSRALPSAASGQVRNRATTGGNPRSPGAGP